MHLLSKISVLALLAHASALPTSTNSSLPLSERAYEELAITPFHTPDCSGPGWGRTSASSIDIANSKCLNYNLGKNVGVEAMRGYSTGVDWGVGEERLKGICFYNDQECKGTGSGFKPRNKRAGQTEACFGYKDVGAWNAFILVPQGGKSPCRLK